VAISRSLGTPAVPVEDIREYNTEELALIVFASSRCEACNHPDLPGFIEAIRDSVARQAHASALGFVTVGIGIDSDPGAGLGMLDKLGGFDVVSSGGGWANDLGVRYLWRELPGERAVPQVLVTRRTILGPPSPLYGLNDEHVLHRVTGLAGIGAWLERGAPIPRLRDDSD
jgi:hypothetical protein